MYDLETHQKKLGPDYHRLKTMVKRSIEQAIRNKNFGVRNGNFENNAVVKNQGTKQRVQRILGDCWQWETNGQCVKGTIAVSAAISISVEKLHHQIRLRNLSCSRVSENHREPEVPEEKSPSGRMFRWPCKDYLKGTCNNSFCERWHPPECSFYKTKSGCRFGEKCAYAHRQVDEQPTKRSKKNDAKVQWLYRRRVIGMKEDLLPTNVTIDRGNLMRGVIRSWDKSHLNADHLMHGNWVVCFKT